MLFRPRLPQVAALNASSCVYAALKSKFWHYWFEFMLFLKSLSVSTEYFN